MTRRVNSSAFRIFHRYQLFFFVAFLLVTIQLYLGYNFYSISQEEQRNLEAEWRDRSKTSSLEKAHEKRLLFEHPLEQIPAGSRHAALDGNQIGQLKNTSHALDVYRTIAGSHAPDELGKDSPNDRPKKGFSARCQISDYYEKEAFSALQRATSVDCKQEISDVVCSQKEGKLFTGKELPNYCTLRTKRRGQYFGCYKDSKEKRTISDLTKTFTTDNTVDKCILTCLQSGYEYAGVEWGIECYCSEIFKNKEATLVEPEYCSTPCSGDPTSKCGGYNAVSVYATGAGARKYTYPPLVDPDDVTTDTPRARIVFILTLNGRAVRQIARLIKALYHRDHYVLIHVDSRQEYLHTEISRMTAQYPNIRMAPDRFATIWGGANLSAMLLKCIEYLFKGTDWDWDFIINLSESDFPIRPVDQLIAFLTMNKGLNFLKSHGKDTARFIQKQGLERTFVQCDNRMWRVGERKLPRGIRIDGGSDWVALNREFCEYLVTSNDDMIKGLREYWKYTLLPGESFWHTVLQNSRFCMTFGNNNLHVVNWMRKKGCKCQYKAIVDWCGCSPNDFIDGDMAKIMTLHEKKKVVFFARKFEAIVSQEIINQLDAFLHGSYPEGTQGLTSYWENIYTHEDKATKLSDIAATFYHGFARSILSYVEVETSSGACTMNTVEILEVNVLKQLDVYQGLLVKMTSQRPTDNTTHTIEALIQYRPMLQLYGTGEAVSRLKNILVGLNFDPKEEFFRSHGNLLGPHSVFTVALYWVIGPALKVTVSVIDAAQVIATSFEIDVANTEHAVPLVMEFEQPLRPGIWTVKVQFQWTIIAESHFLVSPYSHYGHRPITDGEAAQLHAGPPGLYMQDKDHRNIAHLLDLDDPILAQSVALRNAAKTGQNLLSWIDDLIAKFWIVGDYCSTSPVSRCLKMQLCKQTTWSSLSPDPKSELGRVNVETGRIR